MLAHPNVGGLIYFTRNFENVSQIAELTQRVREVRSDILIAVDHEGGRVQRFKQGFTQLPPMALLGRMYEHNPGRATATAFHLAWILSSELLAVGIDISFTPVLDVDYGGSDIIGDRAFHHTPEVITELAGACIAGMQQAGMASTGKHFPGHGYVAEDSHVARPVDPRSLDDMLQTDMLPFKHLAKKGLDAMMLAHVIYAQVDDRPASFSETWIRQILRRQLQFEGAVFSDDLSMQAADLGVGFSERSRIALDAGCDMVLVCNNSRAVEHVVENITLPEDWTQRRINRMSGRFDFNSMRELTSSMQWINSKKILEKAVI